MKLVVPEEDTEGVTNITQANLIYKESANKHMVIRGTSFVGMEVAAALVDTLASVTVIGRDPVPFIGSLGEKVGKFMLDLLTKEKGGLVLFGGGREGVHW